MKFSIALVSVLALGLPCFAQVVEGLRGGSTGSTFNQQLLMQRQPTPKGKGVVVFIGDRVIPQFVDGGSWKTAVTALNLENRSVQFDVLFFQDDGTDLLVPVVGQGNVRGMSITLGTASSLTFETAGGSSDLKQGWALLSQTTNDSIGLMTVFSQSVPGKQTQEAVVPTVNQFSDHFVLLFDNTSFTSAIAVANPTLNTVTIPVNVNEQGQIIDTQAFQLGPYCHTAFALPGKWPSTAGRRGAIEFMTTGFGVGALGLRFNGSAFTSFHVLENFNWTVH